MYKADLTTGARLTWAVCLSYQDGDTFTHWCETEADAVDLASASITQLPQEQMLSCQVMQLLHHWDHVASNADEPTPV